MTVYYVLDDGVNPGTRVSGGYASPQNISAAAMGAANYYNNINAVHAGNTLSPGDLVLLFDTHDHEYGVNTIIDFKNKVIYESVSVNDGSVYSPGAHEKANSGLYDITLDSVNASVLNLRGISFSVGDIMPIAYGFNSTWYILDCTFELTSGSSLDYVRFGQGNNEIFLKNCDFIFNTPGQFLSLASSNKIKFDGIDIIGATTRLFQCANSGGSVVRINNSDLSAVTDAIIDFISLTNGDSTQLTITKCKITPGTLLSKDTTTFYDAQKVDAWSISNGIDGDNAWHYWEFQRSTGIILESTVVQRTGGSLYDEDDVSSLYTAEFRTSNEVIEYHVPLPLTDFINFTLDLTTGATLTFHGIQQDPNFTPSDLTDHQWWVEVMHPESASAQAFATVIDSRATDSLETPAALPVSTETFNGTSGNTNKQSISIDIPAMALTKAQISVNVCFAKDLTVADASGANAIEFFACLKPVVT